MKKIFFFLFTALLLLGCQSKPITEETISTIGGSYENVTPTELKSMLGSKDFVLLNVHIPFAGNIPGTDLSITYNEIESISTAGR